LRPFGLGTVELLVRALDPQRRDERTHCGAKAPPMLMGTLTSTPWATADRAALHLEADALGHVWPKAGRAVGQDDGVFLAAETRHGVHRAHAVGSAWPTRG
jgi:hypothetical protein